MPILSIVFIILTLFSLNVYSCILNGNEFGMFSIIKQFFINYKVIITSIIALIVIIESYTILGPTAGIFCVLTILLIHFNVIKLSLFDSIPEKYLSPMVSSEKANKNCAAGVIQAGGKKKESMDTRSFNTKLKQISKQLSKAN